MLSFFQKNKSKKHQQQNQSTNALPTSSAETTKASTLAEVKESLTATLSSRLKHKGSIRSINIDLSELPSAGGQFSHQQQPETKFHMLKKKSSESFLARLGIDERKKEPSVIQEDDTSHLSSHDGTLKQKTSRFMNKPHIPFITSGYFTVGRSKKPAPSIGE
jgi:hypothetical protein